MKKINKMRNNTFQKYISITKIDWLILVLLMVLSSSGCALFIVGAAAGAGAAGAAYVKGDLEANVTADTRKIEKAAVETLKVLDINKISSDSSALDAEIIGRTADDTKVTIKAKTKEDGGSALSIRVGTFGDESMSRIIYDEIKKHLPNEK